MSPGRLEPPHLVVERTLSSSGPGGCVVIVEDTSEADLRFAVNTVTTNGVRIHRRVTVMRFSERQEGISVGISSQSGAVEVEDLLAAAEEDASKAPPAENAAPLIAGQVSSDFEEPPVRNEPAVLGGVLSGLGGAFERARTSGRILAGFAEHSVTSTYLGSSTGTRLRHVQPTGKAEFVARDTSGGRSAWVGIGTPDLSVVDVAEVERRLVSRLGWAERHVDLPAGHYQVLLPPDAVADLVLMLGEATSGREAEEGQSVFSRARGRDAGR